MDLFIGLVALFSFSLITFLFFKFNNLKYILFYLLIFTFFLFFLPFLQSHEPDRVLVLWPGVRPELLRWDSQVQDMGPPEASWPHIISISESSPRDLCLNAKTQLHSMTSKQQCQTTSKTGKQPDPLTERLPKIILSSQTPQNTPLDTGQPTRKTRSSLNHQKTGTSLLHQEAYTTH